MYVKIYMNFNNFGKVEMNIFIPNDRDEEEYIDEFLSTILDEELKYGIDWDFV